MAHEPYSGSLHRGGLNYWWQISRRGICTPFVSDSLVLYWVCIESVAPFLTYTTQNQSWKYKLKKMVAWGHRVTSYSGSFCPSVCSCPTMVTPHACVNTHLQVQRPCLVTVDHRKLIDRKASFWLLVLWISVPPFFFFWSTSRPESLFFACEFVASWPPLFEGFGTGSFCMSGFRQLGPCEPCHASFENRILLILGTYSYASWHDLIKTHLALFTSLTCTLNSDI